MSRPCACGAVANLDAVVGDIRKWEHHYDKCEPTCDCGALPVVDNYGYLTGDGWMHTAGDGCGPDLVYQRDEWAALEGRVDE